MTKSDIQIDDVEVVTVPTVCIDSLEEGVYFTGKLGFSEGLFVRAYECVVFLGDASFVWNTDTGYMVADFQQVNVTIHHEPRPA